MAYVSYTPVLVLYVPEHTCAAAEGSDEPAPGDVAVAGYDPQCFMFNDLVHLGTASKCFSRFCTLLS